MADRAARVVYRPLDGWAYPETQQQITPFSAPWSRTVDLLLREADFLGADVVVVELDVAERAIRKDDGLRSDARAASEKVRVSMETGQGPMSWHTDLYTLPMGGQLGWRENVRAIALTLEALRAVDRYGAVHSAEQYQGFRAITAAPAPAFVDADTAFRWVAAQAGQPADDTTPRAAYRAAAKVLHPDTGGDPAMWRLLDEARRLFEAGGLL